MVVKKIVAVPRPALLKANGMVMTPPPITLQVMFMMDPNKVAVWSTDDGVAEPVAPGAPPISGSTSSPRITVVPLELRCMGSSALASHAVATDDSEHGS